MTQTGLKSLYTSFLYFSSKFIPLYNEIWPKIWQTKCHNKMQIWCKNFRKYELIRLGKLCAYSKWNERWFGYFSHQIVKKFNPWFECEGVSHLPYISSHELKHPHNFYSMKTIQKSRLGYVRQLCLYYRLGTTVARNVYWFMHLA